MTAELSTEVAGAREALQKFDPKLRLTFGSPTGGTPFLRVVDENGADVFVFRDADGNPTPPDAEAMLANLRPRYRAELPSKAEQAAKRRVMRNERLRVRREAAARVQAARGWGRSVSDAEWRSRQVRGRQMRQLQDRGPLDGALLERAQIVQRGTSREGRASASRAVARSPGGSDSDLEPDPPLGGREGRR